MHKNEESMNDDFLTIQSLLFNDEEAQLNNAQQWIDI